MADPRPEPPSTPEPEYGDFLLVDLLHPDWKHFFSRYRVDLIGFVVISLIVALIIWGTKWLVSLGSDAGAGM